MSIQSFGKNPKRENSELTQLFGPTGSQKTLKIIGAKFLGLQSAPVILNECTGTPTTPLITWTGLDGDPHLFGFKKKLRDN